MTAGITQRSPQKVGRLIAFLAGRTGTERVAGGAVMHSDHKLRWFYRVGAFTFIIGAVALQVGVLLADHTGVLAPTPSTVSTTVAPTTTAVPSPHATP